MINTYGGGANTTKNGLLFEQTTNLGTAMKVAGFQLNEIPVDFLLPGIH